MKSINTLRIVGDLLYIYLAYCCLCAKMLVCVLLKGIMTVEIKRKIYERMKNWKEKADGSKALLIEGARRIGKSTIAEEFGKTNMKHIY